MAMARNEKKAFDADADADKDAMEIFVGVRVCVCSWHGYVLHSPDWRKIEVVQSFQLLSIVASAACNSYQTSEMRDSDSVAGNVDGDGDVDGDAYTHPDNNIIYSIWIGASSFLIIEMRHTVLQ